MNNFNSATIHGKKLSTKQKKLFSAICQGKKMQHGGAIGCPIGYYFDFDKQQCIKGQYTTDIYFTGNPGRSEYIPEDNAINLSSDASSYSINHEMYHAEQNRNGQLSPYRGVPLNTSVLAVNKEADSPSYWYARQGIRDDEIANVVDNLPQALKQSGRIYTKDLMFAGKNAAKNFVEQNVMYKVPGNSEYEAEQAAMKNLRAKNPISNVNFNFRQEGGNINATGYLDNSPTVNNPYNIIPGGNITMQGVSQPIFATAFKNGKIVKKQLMQPGKNYNFNADYVHEQRMQQGGVNSINMRDWNDFTNYAKKKGYSNNSYLNNRDKNLGQQYLNEYKSLHPETSIDYNMITPIQQSLQNYRNQSLADIKSGKGAFADGVNENNYLSNLSKVDNWLGTNTINSQFPLAYINSYQNNQLVKKENLGYAPLVKLQQGGNIYATGGYTPQDIYNFLFQNDEEQTDSPATAPDESDINTAQQKLDEDQQAFEQKQKDFEDYQQQQEVLNMSMENANYNNEGNPYTSSENVGSNIFSSTSNIGKSVGSINPSVLSTEKDILNSFPGSTRSGIWGDAAHQQRISDHNTGDAEDFTFTSKEQANQIVNKLQSEAKQQNIKYIIYNKQIWNPSISNEWRPHLQGDPHTTHIHVSYNRQQQGGTLTNIQQIIDKFKKSSIYTLPYEELVNLRKQK